MDPTAATREASSPHERSETRDAPDFASAHPGYERPCFPVNNRRKQGPLACGGPGSAMHHSLALALHRIRDTQVSDAFATPIHFSNSPPRSRDAFCARVFSLCFAHPHRGVGGAPRDVRVFARHPLGTPYCVKDARERAYDAARQALARRLASHDAGRSPLGAPPWRFWASGPRFRLLRRPPSYNGGQLPSDPCSELLAARS